MSTLAKRLTENDRYTIMLTALEEIYLTAQKRQTLSNDVQLNNIVLRMEALAHHALKLLERGY